MLVYSYDKLLAGYFIRRVNRYVADVFVPSLGGSEISCYLPNPGSMLGMCVESAEVRLSTCLSPKKRKYIHTMEAIRVNGVWIGCNTHLANSIVAEMLRNRTLPLPEDIATYSSFKREVPAGDSRLDFMLHHPDRHNPTHVEVKTVTMATDWFDVESNNPRGSEPYFRFPATRPYECEPIYQVALFPDCESKRAQKHLLHLRKEAMDENGSALLVYVIMRGDITAIDASRYCDPEYARIFTEALDTGVKCVAMLFELQLDNVNDSHIVLKGQVPVARNTKNLKLLTSPSHCDKRKRKKYRISR